MINPCVWMRHGSSERSSQSPKSRAFRVTGLGFPSRLIAAAPPCALQTCRQTLVEGKRNDRAGTRSWLQAGPASSLLEGWRGSLSVKTSLTLLLRTPPGLPRSRDFARPRTVWSRRLSLAPGTSGSPQWFRLSPSSAGARSSESLLPSEAGRLLFCCNCSVCSWGKEKGNLLLNWHVCAPRHLCELTVTVTALNSGEVLRCLVSHQSFLFVWKL